MNPKCGTIKQTKCDRFRLVDFSDPVPTCCTPLPPEILKKEESLRSADDGEDVLGGIATGGPKICGTKGFEPQSGSSPLPPKSPGGDSPAYGPSQTQPTNGSPELGETDYRGRGAPGGGSEANGKPERTAGHPAGSRSGSLATSIGGPQGDKPGAEQLDTEDPVATKKELSQAQMQTAFEEQLWFELNSLRFLAPQQDAQPQGKPKTFEEVVDKLRKKNVKARGNRKQKVYGNDVDGLALGFFQWCAPVRRGCCCARRPCVCQLARVRPASAVPAAKYPTRDKAHRSRMMWKRLAHLLAAERCAQNNAKVEGKPSLCLGMDTCVQMGRSQIRSRGKELTKRFSPRPPLSPSKEFQNEDEVPCRCPDRESEEGAMQIVPIPGGRGQLVQPPATERLLGQACWARLGRERASALCQDAGACCREADLAPAASTHSNKPGVGRKKSKKELKQKKTKKKDAKPATQQRGDKRSACDTKSCWQPKLKAWRDPSSTGFNNETNEYSDKSDNKKKKRDREKDKREDTAMVDALDQPTDYRRPHAAHEPARARALAHARRCLRAPLMFSTLRSMRWHRYQAYLRIPTPHNAQKRDDDIEIARLTLERRTELIDVNRRTARYYNRDTTGPLVGDFVWAGRGPGPGGRPGCVCPHRPCICGDTESSSTDRMDIPIAPKLEKEALAALKPERMTRQWEIMRNRLAKEQAKRKMQRKCVKETDDGPQIPGFCLGLEKCLLGRAMQTQTAADIARRNITYAPSSAGEDIESVQTTKPGENQCKRDCGMFPPGDRAEQLVARFETDMKGPLHRSRNAPVRSSADQTSRLFGQQEYRGKRLNPFSQAAARRQVFCALTLNQDLNFRYKVNEAPASGQEQSNNTRINKNKTSVHFDDLRAPSSNEESKDTNKYENVGGQKPNWKRNRSKHGKPELMKSDSATDKQGILRALFIRRNRRGASSSSREDLSGT